MFGNVYAALAGVVIGGPVVVGLLAYFDPGTTRVGRWVRTAVVGQCAFALVMVALFLGMALA